MTYIETIEYLPCSIDNSIREVSSIEVRVAKVSFAIIGNQFVEIFQF